MSVSQSSFYNPFDDAMAVRTIRPQSCDTLCGHGDW